MKIAIIGPGALGCLLAASLAKKNDVLLLDHDPGRADQLNRQGLILEEEGRSEKIPVRVCSKASALEGAALVLLCVKSGHVKAVLQNTRPFFDQNTLVLALQNGIGHLSVLPKLLPDTPWALGVTAQGATLAGPGHVKHMGSGLTRIGCPGPSGGRAAEMDQMLSRVAETLSTAKIVTEVVPDILNHVWSKLLVNVGINALTAVYDCPNGGLLESAAALDRMTKAILEGKTVAERSGISLPGDPVTTAKEVCRATAANISSMLQDVRAGKPTEIDAINGALVRLAEKLDIPVPVNQDLVAAVKKIESNYDVFT